MCIIDICSFYPNICLETAKTMFKTIREVVPYKNLNFLILLIKVNVEWQIIWSLAYQCVIMIHGTMMKFSQMMMKFGQMMRAWTNVHPWLLLWAWIRIFMTFCHIDHEFISLVYLGKKVVCLFCYDKTMVPLPCTWYHLESPRWTGVHPSCF